MSTDTATEMTDIRVAFLKENATWSGFYHSLKEQFDRKGYLSPKQIACIDKGIAKAQTKDKANDKVANSFDGTQLAQAFETAMLGGLKRPKIAVRGYTFSIASQQSRNAGMIYVKRQDDEAYLGKMTADGTSFYPTRACSEHDTAQINFQLRDPIQSALAYAHETGSCFACHRELTQAASIAAGCGATCASRYGIEYDASLNDTQRSAA